LRRDPKAAATGVTIELRYRPPYDWPAMLAFFRARAIDGVERVDGEVYRRVIRHDGRLGIVEVAHVPDRLALRATIRFPLVQALPRIVDRVRRAFDLDADVLAIGAHLAGDPILGRLVAGRPGLRVPGAFDGFEIAVRAILGQQVALEQARRLGSALVVLAGPSTGDDALPRVFPAPSEVVSADLAGLRMPRARQRALRALAEAAIADPRLFELGASLDDTLDRFRSIDGIGEWTASYVALRAFAEPDAFPATDAALLRVASRLRIRDLIRRAERWRPWRAYAAQHLWEALS
jgi:AraC family transcriptional regulator of adaptative response / DNA-3-methyladenine glycosylase II